MERKDSSLKIIDLYLAQELHMASLYERFAKYYTAHEDFWVSLVSEEHEHAAWIKHFMDGLDQGKINFAEGSTRIAAINSIVTYISTLIDEFDKLPFDLKKAANICLDLEKSLIERNVFRHFGSDSLEVKNVLDILSNEQEKHIEKIKQFTVSL
jgi:hypothetical protein